MEISESVIIKPAKLSGNIKAVSSKSFAHRIFISAALSKEKTTIICSDISEDISTTIDVLKSLGAVISRDGNKYEVIPIPEHSSGKEICGGLNCNDSGSTLRFILPVAAALGISTSIFGSNRLPSRPITELIQVICEKNISFSRDRLPLCMHGQLVSGVYTIRGDISSQYISGLLLALPLLSGDSEINLLTPLESIHYVEMTIDVLKIFGININFQGGRRFIIKGGQKYKSPGIIEIENDWSSAAFFLAAGAIGGDIGISGLDLKSSQGDRIILEILENMGADISFTHNRIEVRHNELYSQNINVKDFPDLFPILAVTAMFSSGTTVFTGTERLRHKESDRIASTGDMITSLGGNFTETNSEVIIKGGIRKTRDPVEIDSYSDHRIAMSAAVGASFIENNRGVKINGFDSITKSYRSFLDDMIKLGGDIKNVSF